MADHQIFSLGDFSLEGGMVLRDAKLVYKTYGELNARKTNAVLLPSWYTGTHAGYEFLIKPGRCFDPAKYFVIATNMFANGLSSSPSNTPIPMQGPHFPTITIRDNVHAQHRLVTEKLGLEKLAMVAGFSMGAQQTFQWGVSYPDMVERIAPWAGAARTTPHTHVFIEGFTGALKADAAWKGGAYRKQPERGLRAMARVYAGWGFSQAWYRQELYKEFGHPSVEDFLVAFWENFFLQCDANNLLSQAKTWQTHNVGTSPGFNGDHKKALASIKARAVVMPGQTDLYFPVEDNATEVACMPNAVLKPIPSIWGHFAGFGINTADTEFLDRAIKECLAE
jgi:homoserine O-acetyltransferase